MEIVITVGIVLVISAFISFLWVRGIEHMHKNHPNYKGEDFLNWDGKNPWEDITTTAGRDGWDDNKIYSEENF